MYKTISIKIISPGLLLRVRYEHTTGSWGVRSGDPEVSSRCHTVVGEIFYEERGLVDDIDATSNTMIVGIKTADE